jgi:hypothetical protein
MGLRDRFKHSDDSTDPSHEAAWANWLSDDFTPPPMPAPPAYQAPAPTTRPAYSRDQVVQNSYTRRTYATPPQTVQQPVQTPQQAPIQPLMTAPRPAPMPLLPTYDNAMPALDPAAEVTININLPKLQLPRIKHPKEYRKHLPSLPYKKLAVSGVAVIVVGAGGLTAFQVISSKYGSDVALGKNKDVTASAGSAAASAGALVPAAKPSYNPVVQKSKPNLLLFIQTAFNHSVYDWKDYINTLE